MTEKHITIPRGKTHRTTAETVYRYLRDHPEQWPSDDANRAGTGHGALVILLDGTESAMKISELTRRSYSVFPAVARNGFSSTGDRIGNGAVFHGFEVTGIPGYDKDVTDPEWVIKCLRLVSLRIDRYHRKQERRRAEWEAAHGPNDRGRA